MALIISRMQIEDFEWAKKWAAAEGWYIGQCEDQAYFRADPNGYFMLLDRDEPVGIISAVKYSQVYGFLGLLIVKSTCRRQGYAKRLFECALNYVSECDIVGLYAVLPRVPYYEKFGFQKNAFLHRFKGIANQVNCQYKILPNQVYEVVGIDSTNISQLSNFISIYKHELFYQQLGFFIELCKVQQAISFAALNDNGDICGIAVARPCVQGYRIGPIIAKNSNISLILINHIVQSLHDNMIFLDIIVPHTLEDLLLNCGFKRDPDYDTLSMYKTKDANRVSTLSTDLGAIASLELG